MKSVVHGIGADVRQIGKHPQAVHLAHDLSAQAAQAVVFRAVGGGIGPVDVVPEEAGDFAAAMDPLYVIRRARLFEGGGRVRGASLGNGDAWSTEAPGGRGERGAKLA